MAVDSVVSVFLIKVILSVMRVCLFGCDSVVPLIGDSLGILMQRQPKELDDILPGCFHRVRSAHIGVSYLVSCNLSC